MAVSEERAIIGEQQDQITGPEQDVKLHEGGHGGIPDHRLEGGPPLSVMEPALDPVEEIATGSRAEYVKQHDDRPKADGRGHDQVFRLRDHFSVLDKGPYPETVGEIHITELDPSGPDEQSAE